MRRARAYAHMCAKQARTRFFLSLLYSASDSRAQKAVKTFAHSFVWKTKCKQLNPPPYIVACTLCRKLCDRHSPFQNEPEHSVCARNSQSQCEPCPLDSACGCLCVKTCMFPFVRRFHSGRGANDNKNRFYFWRSCLLKSQACFWIFCFRNLRCVLLVASSRSDATPKCGDGERAKMCGDWKTFVKIKRIRQKIHRVCARWSV